MSVTLAPSLLGVGGAFTGIAPANLLDILDVNGNQYYLADRVMVETPAIPTTEGPTVVYKPWLLAVPHFTMHRSLVTDSGAFVIQNVSGTTLQRDLEMNLRASALRGAFFIYRCWQSDAEASWLEVHGKLAVDDLGVDVGQIHASQLLTPAEDATPLEIYCETCQLNWGLARCGSTQPTECLYSFQSCQVVERIMVTMNSYEKNYGETTANVPLTVINRSRRI